LLAFALRLRVMNAVFDLVTFVRITFDSDRLSYRRINSHPVATFSRSV
jgi:hypothetical protein